MKYRYLRVGEIVRKGDQFEHASQYWVPVLDSIGSKVSITDSQIGFRIRRAIAPSERTKQLKNTFLLRRVDGSVKVRTKAAYEREKETILLRGNGVHERVFSTINGVVHTLIEPTI